MSLNRTNTSPQERTRSVTVLSAGATLTNIAAALTDYSAALRVGADLRPFSKVRITGNVTTQAANGGEVRLQYSLDNSTFAYFDTTGSGPAVSLIGTGVKFSEWETIPDAAKRGSIVLRLITISGDGAEDPVVGTITMELA